MTKPMTEQELNEARALEQAATPGPWEVAGPWPKLSVYVDNDPDDSMAPIEVCETWANYGVPPSDRARADAAFIAASRTLVPRLIAEVDRLRAELGHVEPAEEPSCHGVAVDGERCVCCGQVISAGDAVAVFYDEGREVTAHYYVCPEPSALWFVAWQYNAGGRSDTKHRPVPYEMAYAEAKRFREVNGHALTRVMVRRADRG